MSRQTSTSGRSNEPTPRLQPYDTASALELKTDAVAGKARVDVGSKTVDRSSPSRLMARAGTKVPTLKTEHRELDGRVSLPEMSPTAIVLMQPEEDSALEDKAALSAEGSNDQKERALPPLRTEMDPSGQLLLMPQTPLEASLEQTPLPVGDGVTVEIKNE